MSELNYKAKYQELKLKFMNSVDMAYRLGYEQGMKDEQSNSMKQQADQAMQMGQAQAGNSAQEESRQEPGQESAEAPVSEHPGGSELDQHIAKLEGLIGKSDDAEIKKSLEALKSFRNAQLQAIELKKSDKAIQNIAKTLNRSYNMGAQAAQNLDDNAKKSLSLQEKIVGDIMSKWEQEENKVAKDISSVLNIENLTKKI